MLSGAYYSFSPCSEEVEALAQRCHMRLYRTSVKEDINICNVFQHLAENYVNKVGGRELVGRENALIEFVYLEMERILSGF